MARQMDKLPINYEQFRSLMFEELGKLSQEMQLTTFYELVGRAAVEKGIVADPNGPTPDRHAQYFLSSSDMATAQDIMWDFIIEGIIRPGLGIDSGNSELPFFHVTAYGRQQIEHGTSSPHDPDGYLQRLRNDVPNLDGVVLTYLNECMRTFRIGCLLSSAVTLGCASEKALLLLIDAYATARPPTEEARFRKKTAGRFIKTQFEEFNKMLNGHLRPLLPRELEDGLTNILLGVFEMIRTERNDAGHPTGKIPSRDVLFANISVFPGYLKRVYDLIDWLQSKGPGGLR